MINIYRNQPNIFQDKKYIYRLKYHCHLSRYITCCFNIVVVLISSYVPNMSSVEIFTCRSVIKIQTMTYYIHVYLSTGKDVNSNNT